MKLNWKATVGFIFAVLIVSISAFFGIQTEQRVDLETCGYMIVKDKMIELHTPCKIQVSVGDIRVYEEDRRVALVIPGGWKWRIIP